MKYLQHIEHAPENLQFFLWFRDYTLRFEKSKPPNPFSTPPSTGTSDRPNFVSTEYQIDSAVRFHNGAGDERPKNQIMSIMNAPPQFIAPWETDFDKEGSSLMEVPSSAQDSYRMIAEKAFDRAGVKIPGTDFYTFISVEKLIYLQIVACHTVMRLTESLPYILQIMALMS